MSRSSSASALAIFVVLMLAACGGGGGGNDVPPPGGSEGTASSPVAISVDVSHAGYAGAFPSSSYYYFQANLAGDYTISLTNVNTDLSWDLYDAPGFVGWSMDWCDEHMYTAEAEICTVRIDAPGVYYLEVRNWDMVQSIYTVKVAPPPSGCTVAGCFDFEDGLVPAVFINSAGSDAAWEVDTANAANGVNSLRSGAITHRQASCVEHAPPTNTSKVSFMLMTSTEEGYDFLRFYIDGVEQDKWSGDTSWMGVTFTTTSAAHVYKWCYDRDANDLFPSGSDTVWVDDIDIKVQ